MQPMATGCPGTFCRARGCTRGMLPQAMIPVRYMGAPRFLVPLPAFVGITSKPLGGGAEILLDREHAIVVAGAQLAGVQANRELANAVAVAATAAWMNVVAMRLGDPTRGKRLAHGSYL